ncbi:hypothetical protein FLONG3_6562 [Fusarium longipes]|uniref:HTH OST-type domain-containing protein n=1 Tax=Fusarium longipes TaxID=694270 RepID=A0A395SKF8_9HYPO|nr:hypothetical protein FLONG3_6562 [Fusarium longipes]
MPSVATTRKIAVLIDADNASAALAGSVLAEIAKYGKTFVKRAYGDWTGTGLNQWKERLLEQSIQPMQQFAYTKGKNSTDSAMIIDAMDLLYSNKFDGFCIMSSDSDFTRLASRIRESGLLVFGCGKKQTPKPFVTACDKFIYIENLVEKTATVEAEVSVAEPLNGCSSIAGPMSPDKAITTRSHYPIASSSLAMGKGSEGLDNDVVSNGEQGEKHHLVDTSTAGTSPKHHCINAEVVEWLSEAVEVSSDDHGWALLSDVGLLMVQWHSDFDSRTYGFKKLSKLFNSLDSFEVSHRAPESGKTEEAYVRQRSR